MPIGSSLPKKDFKITDIPDASETVKGLVKLSSDMTSNDTTGAVTLSAVKSIYDDLQQASSSVIKNIITINGVAGTTFTIANGVETVEGTIGSDGTGTIRIGGMGEFTATGMLQGKTATCTYNIEYIGIHSFDLYVSISFNADAFSVISKLSKSGFASSYYAIGDVKEVTLNGAVGKGLTFSSTKAYMQILAFDHNKDAEMNGEPHILCGFGKSALSGGKDVCFVDSYYGKTRSGYTGYFNMRTSSANGTGWISEMRTRCTELKSTLPSDLQSVLRTRSIYTYNGSSGNTTSDEVYIPAEFEVFGSRTSANTDEQNNQKQLAYYANGNSKIRYKHSDTSTAAIWWLRSPKSSNSRYCYVNASGALGDSTAYYSYGMVPLITI